MLNLEKKNVELVNGLVILKKVSEEQIVDDLVKINVILDNDLYQTAILAERISRGAGSSVHVPVVTDRDKWNQIKAAKINKIATSEKKVAAC